MINQEQLKEALNYNPVTGDFTWAKGTRKGRLAGSVDLKGYLKMQVQGKSYYAHRLAFIHEGVELPRCIDHIDGNPSNNRWDNLRPATHRQNSYNRKLHKNNCSGAKGVRYSPYYECWEIRVVANGKTYEEYADDYHSAVEAASRLRKELHGEFARDE